MKYYLIAGEASGDLHASLLISALIRYDKDAEFRFFGGDKMQEACYKPNKEAGSDSKVSCGKIVRHYRDLAFMGFIPVLMHLPTILANMKLCKNDIISWNPDVLILIDYPGFNLDIAKYIKKHTHIPICYYISPKIWAWKEYRIKNIKRDIDHLFSILPFEIDFFEQKHNYHIDYVGNPTLEEVQDYLSEKGKTLIETSQIAILAGSRKQEIKENLPMMLEAAKHFPDYNFIIAGAPGIDPDYYNRFIADNKQVTIQFGKTYDILHSSAAALVTSGTATLETALLNTPQVVCYYTPFGKLISFLRKHLLKVKYISLVNLIVGRNLVTELVADTMTVENICTQLNKLLTSDTDRADMLKGYAEMRNILGTNKAAPTAARKIIEYYGSKD